jgi:hypothetical protein
MAAQDFDFSTILPRTPMARIGWQNRIVSVNLRRLEIAIEAALSVSPSLLAVLDSKPSGWTIPGRSCASCNRHVAIKVNCAKQLTSAMKMRAGHLYAYVRFPLLTLNLTLIHSQVQKLPMVAQYSSFPSRVRKTAMGLGQTPQ